MGRLVSQPLYSKASQASSPPVQKGIHITSLTSIPAIQLDVLSCIPLWSIYTLSQKKFICILLSYRKPQDEYSTNTAVATPWWFVSHRAIRASTNNASSVSDKRKPEANRARVRSLKSLTSALSLREYTFFVTFFVNTT